MRHRKLFCGAPDLVRHKNCLFLWRTRNPCATETKWGPHPVTPNHWFYFFYGALHLVRHRNNVFCGALAWVRHRNDVFCGALASVRHRNNVSYIMVVPLPRPYTTLSPSPLSPRRRLPWWALPSPSPPPSSARAACRHAPPIPATSSTSRCGVEEEGPARRQGGGATAASRWRSRRDLHPCRRRR